MYTLQKKLETELKAIKTSKEKISSMEPEGYCTRFINYVSKISNGEIDLKRTKTVKHNNTIKEEDENEENDTSKIHDKINEDLTGEQTEFREELWGGLVDHIRIDEKSSTVQVIWLTGTMCMRTCM